MGRGEKVEYKNLEVSPVALIPQKNRWVRIILNFTFPVYPSEGKKRAKQIQFSINKMAESMAPDAPVRR